MRRNPVAAFTILTLTLFAACIKAGAQGRSSEPPQLSLADSVQSSLATVTAYDAQGRVIASGGGCFVRDDVIAADYLTIKDAASIRISTSRAESIPGWLFAVDQSRLLALIHPEGTKGPPLLPEESSNASPSNAAASQIAAGPQALAVTGVRGGLADLIQVTISRPKDKLANQYLAVDSGGQQLQRGSPIIA
ncbi:MAG: hypothetical protein ACREDR_23050, partial [Blastocatellia bacterium]